MIPALFLPLHPLRDEDLPVTLRTAEPILIPAIPRVGDYIEGPHDFQARVEKVAWVWDEDAKRWWVGVQIV